MNCWKLKRDDPCLAPFGKAAGKFQRDSKQNSLGSQSDALPDGVLTLHVSNLDGDGSGTRVHIISISLQGRETLTLATVIELADKTTSNPPPHSLGRSMGIGTSASHAAPPFREVAPFRSVIDGGVDLRNGPHLRAEKSWLFNGSCRIELIDVADYAEEGEDCWAEAVQGPDTPSGWLGLDLEQGNGLNDCVVDRSGSEAGRGISSMDPIVLVRCHASIIQIFTGQRSQEGKRDRERKKAAPSANHSPSAIHVQAPLTPLRTRVHPPSPAYIPQRRNHEPMIQATRGEIANDAPLGGGGRASINESIINIITFQHLISDSIDPVVCIMAAAAAAAAAVNRPVLGSTSLDLPSIMTFRRGVFATEKGIFRCMWEDVNLNHWVNLVHITIEAAGETTDNVVLVPDGCRLAGMMDKAVNSTAVFSLILPTVGGYVSKADFVHVRLQGCQGLLSVVDYFEPLAWYGPPEQSLTSFGLVDLVDKAFSVVRWVVPFSDSLRLTNVLRPRLNFHWLSPEPVARKRLALVGGRRHFLAARAILDAAGTLGIDLVVVDAQGHWLQPDTDENRRHREAFIAIDLTDDDGLTERITGALLEYPKPVDGVFTHNDDFFVAVARVAALLGLPTCPVSALETTSDKYKSRMLQDEPGRTARVSSLAELRALMEQSTFNPVFPLIVKPTKGWASQCVSKVTTLQDLPVAVHKAIGRHGSPAVIEPFFDGPEVDVNLVLLDGEILFSEVTDEPPCEADAQGASVDATFTSETMSIPSALPFDELEAAKETMRNILVDIGCHTGVFHAEARMVNSSVEYGRVSGVGDDAHNVDDRSSDVDASGESVNTEDFDRGLDFLNQRGDFSRHDTAVSDLLGQSDLVVRPDSAQQPDVVDPDVARQSDQTDIVVPNVFVPDLANQSDIVTPDLGQQSKPDRLNLIDLMPKPDDRLPETQVECRLLEINARPPGFSVSRPTRYVHGIDYFAIDMLAALGEHDRLRRAAIPFDFSLAPPARGVPTAQCWSQLVCISAPAAGVVHSDSPCEELKRLNPDLAGHIILVNEYFRKGDRVELYKDGVRVRVADICVISPRSRREVVELGEKVRSGYRIDIR
ncbi:hypothetical protein L249_3718 [Ophiocordyceps polyrhachis-furcata BCC 54312]|uniref:ATP-grasp domain-containing protein n=1 Tax=Ophiocordyceps polyrhachis-furcata BCC 54312 TaxID=1330021 RepID=A0A367L4T5_9HYPO|nr:hypothetical protein L249_3718 [Ophiocordyceps polyrhachis-furcata BCC 54312]